jgi:hypothetical protein
MSTPADTSNLIAELKATRQSGCLTIESTDGRTCRLYLLMGRIFHAEGPTGEGEPALSDASSWSGVTLSFDPNAQLPEQRTIQNDVSTAPSGSTVDGQPAFNRLSDDPRLSLMGCATLGGGCLFIVVPISLAVLAGLFHGSRAASDALLSAALIAIPVLLAVWVALHVGFRVAFYRDAVTLPGRTVASDVPRSVEAPPGIIAGEPELVLEMRVRSSVGRLGTCSITAYQTGLEISKAGQSEPRWQFAYHNVMQAESVDIVITSSRGNTARQTFVRLITDRPPMVFLLGTPWWQLQNRKAEQLVDKLREHGVTTFAESLDT